MVWFKPFKSVFKQIKIATDKQPTFSGNLRSMSGGELAFLKKRMSIPREVLAFARMTSYGVKFWEVLAFARMTSCAVISWEIPARRPESEFYESRDTNQYPTIIDSNPGVGRDLLFIPNRFVIPAKAGTSIPKNIFVQGNSSSYAVNLTNI